VLPFDLKRQGLRPLRRRWHKCSRAIRGGMRIDQFTFGSIRIEGVTYDHERFAEGDVLSGLIHESRGVRDVIESGFRTPTSSSPLGEFARSYPCSSNAAWSPWTSMAFGRVSWAPDWTSIRRGLAVSATGTPRVRTPSSKLATILSTSRFWPRNI
jgi:hypothetical protein